MQIGRKNKNQAVPLHKKLRWENKIYYYHSIPIKTKTCNLGIISENIIKATTTKHISLRWELLQFTKRTHTSKIIYFTALSGDNILQRFSWNWGAKRNLIWWEKIFAFEKITTRNIWPALALELRLHNKNCPEQAQKSKHLDIFFKK